MLFIAFAHVSVCTSDSPIPGTWKKLSIFNRLPNPVEKKRFSKQFSESHSLALYQADFDIEVIRYNNSDNLNSRLGNSKVQFEDIFIKNIIVSSSFSENFLLNLSWLTKQKNHISNGELRFRTLTQNNSVIFKQDDSKPKFNDFLDEEGLASLAFYVDKIDYSWLKENQTAGIISDLTEVFDLSVGKNLFRIVLIKVGGIYIELISRP